MFCSQEGCVLGVKIDHSWRQRNKFLDGGCQHNECCDPMHQRNEFFDQRRRHIGSCD